MINETATSEVSWQKNGVEVIPVLSSSWQEYYGSLSPWKRECLYLQGCNENGMGAKRQAIFCSSLGEAGLPKHELIVLLKNKQDLWGWSAASLAALTGGAEDRVNYYWDAQGWGEKAIEQAYLGWYMAHKEPLWVERSYCVPQLLLRGDGEIAKNAAKNSRGVERGLLLSRIINESRYLIDAPAESMGPLEMEEVARGLALRYGGKMEVIKGEALAEGFPLVQAVGRASSRPPRVLDLSWQKSGGQGGDTLYLCLVGKGVCFDSGGLDLKSAGGMRLMRKDMGGAAIVMGLAEAIMALELPVRLRLLVPLVDNAVSGNAFRPGDVFKARNGVRVEIGNTDAEGRLLLADCLSFASELSPDMLIDVATLTGAARVAVGTDIAALMTRNDAWASRLLVASGEVEDPIWRLPLHDAYKTALSSKVADIASCGESAYAGAITAGLFLEKFVQSGMRDRWCHFDTMAWNLFSRPGRPEGGEAQGVRAILQAIESIIYEQR